MRLVIAYDISDDTDRRRIYRTLQRYGAWRQFSVFELDVSKTERVELEDALQGHVTPENGDRIRIYRLCDSCMDDVHNIGEEPAGDEPNVI